MKDLKQLILEKAKEKAEDKTEKQRPFKEEPQQFEDGTVRLGEDWDDKWISCNDPAHAKLQAKVQELEETIERLKDALFLNDEYAITLADRNKEIQSLQSELSALQSDYADLAEDNGKKILEIEELKEQNRWIPVSERLPEKNVGVLVCFDEYDAALAYINNWGLWRKSLSHLAVSPTHWMHLPTHPKPEEGE
jgi:TolA-binding protein